MSHDGLNGFSCFSARTRTQSWGKSPLNSPITQTNIKRRKKVCPFNAFITPLLVQNPFSVQPLEHSQKVRLPPEGYQMSSEQAWVKLKMLQLLWKPDWKRFRTFSCIFSPPFPSFCCVTHNKDAKWKPKPLAWQQSKWDKESLLLQREIS